MLVGEVGLDPAEPLGIVELNADVIIERTDRRLVTDQDFLRIAKNGEALLRIELAPGGGS